MPEQQVPKFEQLFTQPEAADIARCHLHTIIRARRAGELRYVQFGRAVRIRSGDLQAWIDAHTEGGDGQSQGQPPRF